MGKDEIILEIQNVASSPGFLYTLSLLVRRDLFFDPAEVANAQVDFRSRLNIQELSLLIGLMVRNELDWPAPGFEDTELGVLMEPEVGHGAKEVHTRVQA